MYGSGTDYAEWIEVWIVTGTGTAAVATKLTAVTDYTLSSATGPLATIPRPITNATITLATARTGTLQIVGANRPRRLSQFAENRGVAARDLNQAVTDLVAENRELWDKMGRALVATPGDTIGPLPVAAVRAGGFACYDGSGNPLVCAALTGLGNVVGPNVSVVGHIPIFANTSGTLLADGGLIGTGDLVGPSSSTANHVLTFSNTTGKLAKDSGLTLTPSTGTITLTNAKTLTVDNTLEFSGTDSSVVAFGTGGTVTYTSNNLSVFAATTSAQLLGVISDETGTGALVFANSPLLVTPVLGVATATSINKVAFTAPASGSTLTIADGKTLTASNSITLAGTDGKSLTLTTGLTVTTNDGTIAFGGASKTLTVNNSIGLSGTDGKTLTVSNSGTLGGADGWTLAIAASKTLTVSNSLTFTAGADGQSFAFPSTSDTVTGNAATQTLSNKTLTAPTINGGTATALTGLGIRSTGSGAFDLTLANTENLTAGRVLTLTVNNANRTINLSGNLTLAAAFSTAGGNAITLTGTGTTNVTLPTSGTLATIDVAQTFSAANIFSALTTVTDLKFSSGKLYPSSDSTTALQLCKADAVTCVLRVDTTNARVGINKTPGAFDLDVNGTANIGGVLTVLTASPGTNTTQAASTAFVQAAVVASTTGVSSLNGLTGGLSVVASTGLSVTAAGSSVTVANYLDAGSLSNCTLVGTVSGNALTVALKTQAGADPSASSPCAISFRNATAATGDYTVVSVTAATSFVTGTSGSSFGSTNGAAFRLWITAINNSGTVVLGVSNQSTGSQIYPLNEGAVQSSTACNACTNATSAGVFYSTAAQTSKAIRVLGYMDWGSGLATAGTWASGPTSIQMMGAGVSRPGSVMQLVQVTSSSQTSTTSSTFQASALTASLTPTAAPNLVRIRFTSTIQSATNLTLATWSLHRGAGACTSAIGMNGYLFTNTTGNFDVPIAGTYIDKPGIASAQGYTICIKSTDNASAVILNSQAAASTGDIILEEIQG